MDMMIIGGNPVLYVLAVNVGAKVVASVKVFLLCSLVDT